MTTRSLLALIGPIHTRALVSKIQLSRSLSQWELLNHSLVVVEVELTLEILTWNLLKANSLLNSNSLTRANNQQDLWGSSLTDLRRLFKLRTISSAVNPTTWKMQLWYQRCHRARRMIACRQLNRTSLKPLLPWKLLESHRTSKLYHYNTLKAKPRTMERANRIWELKNRLAVKLRMKLSATSLETIRDSNHTKQ